MNYNVSELEPRMLWKNFARLNKIPRASKKEEKAVAFIKEIGQQLGLVTCVDRTGNILIRKPATHGMEDRKMIVLQSHLDMVHQKNAATAFDFDSQGIRMIIDGNWVKAVDTTLGADNGIGVAAMLAVLESTDLPHPPLEMLFTIDEETGMTGAMGVTADFLEGRILLNLDTENDNEIDIGCAGGIDITATLKYQEEKTETGMTTFTIAVTGLKGGHSGMDIHLGLGNANKIMNVILRRCAELTDLRLASIDGGGLRNAIPRESIAVVAVPEEKQQALSEFLNLEKVRLEKEWQPQEPGLTISFEAVEKVERLMDRATSYRIYETIEAVRNGPVAMSDKVPGLVQTSNNLARVSVGTGKVHITCLTRSSVASAKTELANQLMKVFQKAGFMVDLGGSYPGWDPDPDSVILGIATAQYFRMFGSLPEVQACHAGLECGILKGTYPDMDMISFGPTILGAHSPQERVSIPSVIKFWNFLQCLLKYGP